MATKPCRFCKAPIEWYKNWEGAWIATDAGGTHDCEREIRRREGVAFQAGYDAGRLIGRQGTPSARSESLNPGLAQEDLLALINLTHPDHQPPERREAANRLTALLIKMRRLT